MLEQYLQHIQEGYLFSDKTISVNLDSFLNGSNKKLLIVGVLGSGKTSLGSYLAKKYKVAFFSDESGMIKALQSPQRMIIEGAQIASLYKMKPEVRKLILNQSMIIIGLSAIKAGLRADKRDSTLPGKAKNWKDIYYHSRENLLYWQKAVKFFRRDVEKISGFKIKEYKMPTFKAVFY